MGPAMDRLRRQAAWCARHRPSPSASKRCPILSAVAAPNPFNPTTTLHLQVPMRSSVWLTIYNVAGQVVRTLLDDYELDAGYHTIDWDGRDQQGQPVTSGVYLYQLRAGTQAIVHKLLLLR